MGRNNPGVRDGTGPAAGSYQRNASGNVGKRLMGESTEYGKVQGTIGTPANLAAMRARGLRRRAKTVRMKRKAASNA